MKRLGALAAIAVMLVALTAGCGGDNSAIRETSGEYGEHGEGGEGSGEHDGNGEGGEESGTQLALNETYDEVRNGAHLILAYDAKSNSFIGTVGNTTNNILQQVRIEVHLSNGIELGPTTPVDLGPGEESDVTLTATSASFDTWSAHPEAGSGEGDEHGDGGEGREHGGGG